MNQFLWSKSLFSLFKWPIYFVKSPPPLHRTKSFQLLSGESFLLWSSCSVAFSKQNPWNTLWCWRGFVEQYKILVRNMEQMWRPETESLSLVLLCKHLKMGWTLVLSWKAPFKEYMDLWTQMAFTIYRRWNEVYFVKKTWSHVYIASVGDPLSVWH